MAGKKAKAGCRGRDRSETAESWLSFATRRQSGKLTRVLKPVQNNALPPRLLLGRETQICDCFCSGAVSLWRAQGGRKALAGAYKRAMLKFHPDRTQKDSTEQRILAAEVTKWITHAWQNLS